MKKHLLIKLILFCLPFAIATVIPLSVAFIAGEIMPLRLIAELRSQDHTLLYGPRFGRNQFAFNLLTVNERKPDVLIIGSSRSWMFRSALLNKAPTAFYNASDAGWTLDEISAFIHALDANAQPQIMLLSIDKPWFNPDFKLQDRESITNTTSQNPFAITRSLMGYLLANPSHLPDLLGTRDPIYGRPALGLDAITIGIGVRYDGSLQHGEIINGTAPIAAMKKTHQQNVQEETDIFVPGNQISSAALTKLEDILAYAQSQGSYVVGIAPPFSPDIYEALLASGDHTYIWELDDRLANLFENHGFIYLNFTDPTAVAATEADFWDGWHTSELISTRMYHEILLTVPDMLAQYSDTDYIEQAISEASNTFEVFDNFE